MELLVNFNGLKKTLCKDDNHIDKKLNKGLYLKNTMPMK